MCLLSVSLYCTVAGPEIISDDYIFTYHNIVLNDYHIELFTLYSKEYHDIAISKHLSNTMVLLLVLLRVLS